MTTVFTHTTVVTVDPGQTVLYDVALAVDGDKIAAMGPTETVLQAYPQADIYDGRGKALFPGLINCHAHLTATLNRGITEDFGFPPALHLPVQAQSLLCCRRSHRDGAARRPGKPQVRHHNAGGACPGYWRLCCRGGQNGAAPGAGGKRPRCSATTLAGNLERTSTSSPQPCVTRRCNACTICLAPGTRLAMGLVTVFPAATLSEASSPELLRAVRAFAEQHDLGYTIHLAQSRLEVESMMRLRGVRPTFFLHTHDFLSPRLFAAHCRYVDASEIALLGNARTMVTHQAGMAARRAVIPPIPALRAAGCPIAMGTDNNSQDMLEVMRMGLVTERILRDNSMQPQPEDMLRETTMGGACALRQQHAIGSLEVGKKADLLVVDTQRSHLVPTMRIVSAWIHNGQSGDIESVMVNGKFLMRHRQVLTMDEESIIREADKIGRRVWNQLLERYPTAPFPTRLAPPL